MPKPKKSLEPNKINLKESFASLKFVPRFFKEIRKVNPLLFFANIDSRILSAVIPLALLWVGKIIIDEVVVQIDAEVKDFYAEHETYDTLLFLMNGTGIIGHLINTDNFLGICKEVLKPGGQILIDSSDLSFLEDEEEPNNDLDRKYIGEIDFCISYKGEKSNYFPWLYMDFELLKLAAEKNNFNCELIVEGKHYDYLAKLTIRND